MHQEEEEEEEEKHNLQVKVARSGGGNGARFIWEAAPNAPRSKKSGDLSKQGIKKRPGGIVINQNAPWTRLKQSVRDLVTCVCGDGIPEPANYYSTTYEVSRVNTGETYKNGTDFDQDAEAWDGAGETWKETDPLLLYAQGDETKES